MSDKRDHKIFYGALGGFAIITGALIYVGTQNKNETKSDAKAIDSYSSSEEDEDSDIDIDDGGIWN